MGSGATVLDGWLDWWDLLGFGGGAGGLISSVGGGGGSDITR